MRQIAPALQYNEGRSKPWTGAVVTNGFAENAEGDKQNVFAILGCPGWVDFSAIGGGAPRGLHRMGATLYALLGTTLWAVDRLGNATNAGSVPGADVVQMADNGAELCIAAAGTGYVLSSGAITTPVPFDVSGVAYIDGEILWTFKDTDQFIISALNDALTYDPADIASVEGAPDNLTGLVVSQREVFFPGADTIEVWWNNGAADFPFARQGNAFIERGVPFPRTFIRCDNTTAFLADDGMVYELNGYAPQRISTHAIEYKLKGVGEAWAYSYTLEGHKFYILVTDVGTYAFDFATRLWHRRQSYGSELTLTKFAVNAFGTVICAASDGNLYELSMDVNSEGASPIVLTLELPTIQTDRDLRTLYAFEVYCETGIGSATGSNPQIVFQYSRDSGRTWSSELSRPLGVAGDFIRRAIWRVGVKFRQLNIRLKISDAVRRVAISYWVDAR